MLLVPNNDGHHRTKHILRGFVETIDKKVQREVQGGISSSFESGFEASRSIANLFALDVASVERSKPCDPDRRPQRRHTKCYGPPEAIYVDKCPRRDVGKTKYGGENIKVELGSDKID